MNTVTLKFSASEQSVGLVIDKANELLRKNHCPEDTRRNIDVILDEICGNVACYAFPDETGSFSVCMHVEDRFSEFTVIDGGIPFNPLEVTGTINSEEPSVGGVGLIIARDLSDSIDYQYLDNENRLHFIKTWE